MKIHFFGIGAAINQLNDNTYFLIEDGKNNLQVDCGGGKTLTRKVKFDNYMFNNLFISHKHPDHILGFFHLIRVFKKGLLEKLNIYCSSDIKKTIIDISYSLGDLNKKIIDSDIINFIEINNIEEINAGDFLLKPIDLQSNKIEQYGFLLEYKGKKILFFGDEAIGVLNRNDLDKFLGVDYLIIESVCIDKMSLKSGGKVDTKKISHITSREAGKIARLLDAKNLILIHTMDLCSINRQKMLSDDAKSEFNGNIIIPNGGDIIDVI